MDIDIRKTNSINQKYSIYYINHYIIKYINLIPQEIDTYIYL